MFQSKENKSILKSDSSLFTVYSEDNYILQVNDWLELSVYTNDGELLIDPLNQLGSLISGGGNGGSNSNRTQNIGAQQKNQKYLVLQDGTVRLPMVGFIKVDGRNIIDVEKELQKKFSEYYIDPYVRVKPLNKRVLLFTGSGGKVIALENENMTLLEILALGSEVATGSNAKNIKIIRGDLKDPEVLQVDLSTIDGLKQYNLRIQPNDVIYVQAKRNRVTEVLKDISPFLSFSSTVLLLIFNLGRLQ